MVGTANNAMVGNGKGGIMRSRVNFTIFTKAGPVTLRGLDWSQCGALQTICIRYRLKHFISEILEGANQ